jgi:hypothetical protein
MTGISNAERAAAIRILVTLGRYYPNLPKLSEIDLKADYAVDLMEAIKLERLVYQRDRDSHKRVERRRRQRGGAGQDSSESVGEL